MRQLFALWSAILITLASALVFGPTRARATQASSSSEATAGNAENGKRDFVKFGCYECHGREAQGAYGTAPRIGPNPIPFAAFSSYVHKPTREMPPYTSKVLSDQELADIYAFVLTRPRPVAITSLSK